MKYSGVFGRQVCNQMILTTSMHMQHQLPWVHNLHVKEKSTLLSVFQFIHLCIVGSEYRFLYREKDYFLVNKDCACTMGAGFKIFVYLYRACDCPCS